jgi:predicted DsbA family dithiol-disulfide isomerase
LIDVEIWSDVACPWCYIGKRRFESALASFEHRDDVAVTWRSFELDPDAPAEVGGDRAERLASKYGVSVERAQQMQDHLTSVAAEEGLGFRFDVARSGNMLDAHRLVHLASAHGSQDAMKERLLLAYLCEGELVSDHETLTRLAVEVGLPEDETRSMLASDLYADEVRSDEATARSLGISAVPFFVVDRAFGASGAQPPDVLRGLLERAWAERSPLAVVADGETCGPDGC